MKTGNKQAYLEMAKKVVPIFAEYGAMRTVECWGDDVRDGKITDLKKAVQANDDETVVFSWIVYRNRAERDTINAKVMADPRLEKELPFDGK